jgi:hypothetical protein
MGRAVPVVIVFLLHKKAYARRGVHIHQQHRLPANSLSTLGTVAAVDSRSSRYKHSVLVVETIAGNTCMVQGLADRWMLARHHAGQAHGDALRRPQALDHLKHSPTTKTCWCRGRRPWLVCCSSVALGVHTTRPHGIKHIRASGLPYTSVSARPQAC